jgi:hypothetical protein
MSKTPSHQTISLRSSRNRFSAESMSFQLPQLFPKPYSFLLIISSSSRSNSGSSLFIFIKGLTTGTIKNYRSTSMASSGKQTGARGKMPPFIMWKSFLSIILHPQALSSLPLSKTRIVFGHSGMSYFLISRALKIAAFAQTTILGNVLSGRRCSCLGWSLRLQKKGGILKPEMTDPITAQV